MLRRITAVGGALLFGAAFSVSGAVGARADVDHGISDVVALAFTARITSDSDADTPPAVDLLGGSGSSSFATVVCGMWSDGDPVTPAEAALCSASGGVSFANTVCGTGSASGISVTLSSPVESGSANLGVTFVATIGVVTGTMTTTGPDDAASETEPVDGLLVLSTSQRSTALDAADCTDAFSVIGGLVALG